MRTFETVEELYGEVERDLAEMGVSYKSDSVQDVKKSIPTLELMNYVYTIPNTRNFIDVGKIAKIWNSRGEDPRLLWLIEESYERTNYETFEETNPGRAYLKNIDFWKPYLKNGRFSYTYAERMRPQYNALIIELEKHPYTRQAIFEIYNSYNDMKNWGGKSRIPCTMHYQFLIRNNQIHMNHIMRSCDFERFFLLDLYLAIYLLIEVFLELNQRGDKDLEMGSFTQFIGSLHVFPENLTGVF